MADETKSQWVVDATDECFEKEVIQRSQSTLCLVDFWAEWCAPCRILGPVLEELANDYQGKFTLVKVDTEKAPQASMNYGVQSIPIVFAFLGGEPVDAFTGSLAKAQIKEWIDNQLVSQEVSNALKLVDSEPDTAIEKLTAIRSSQADQPTLLMGLATAHLNKGSVDQAKLIIETLEERGFLEPEAQKIKAKIEMHSRSNIDIEQALQQAESDPTNLGLQFKYASGLVGQQEYGKALEICLGLVEADKTGVGEQARQLMVDIFRALPDESELTHEYRRKLTMALY
ncbi:MAG: tetratricopeptide repeat protein [Planctomycetota bacterium]|nr:tetratricopeptide repeat protein [Planctomycetota bacterium]